MNDNKQTTPVVEPTPTQTTIVEDNKVDANSMQDELNKVASKVRAEERAKSEKAIQDAVNVAIAEYERKAKLTAEEKEKEERSKREKEIAEREQSITLREMRIEAKDMLIQKHIPIELVDFVVDIDANKTKENIEKLAKTYGKSIEDGVTEKLKGKPIEDFSTSNLQKDKKTVSGAF